jgi:hypothetical protein
MSSRTDLVSALEPDNLGIIPQIRTPKVNDLIFLWRKREVSAPAGIPKFMVARNASGYVT